MSDQAELAVVRQEPQEMAVAEPSRGQIMLAIVKSGVTKENAEAFKVLAELQYREEDRNAEKQFNKAFVALQNEIPQVTAKTPMPNRGKYERFEDLMVVLKPLLEKHGFAVSFSQDFKESRIVQTCYLSHTSGHSRSNSFAVRAKKADDETKSDCGAATTAKRYALCNALNMVIRQESLSEEDAAVEGSFISKEMAEDLRTRLRASGGDEAAFLKFAGAKTYEEIGIVKYWMVEKSLRRKENTAK